MYDSEWLEENTPSDYFPSLKDVKIKAEDYVSELPLHLFNNILRSTSKSLTICQVSYTNQSQSNVDTLLEISRTALLLFK